MNDFNAERPPNGISAQDWATTPPSVRNLLDPDSGFGPSEDMGHSLVAQENLRFYESSIRLLKEIRGKLTYEVLGQDAEYIFHREDINSVLSPVLDELGFIQGVFAFFWEGERLQIVIKRSIQHLPWRKVEEEKDGDGRVIRHRFMPLDAENDEAVQKLVRVFEADHHEQGKIFNAHRTSMSCWERERGVVFASDGEMSFRSWEYSVRSALEKGATIDADWIAEHAIRQGLIEKNQATERLQRMMEWWWDVLSSGEEYAAYCVGQDRRTALQRSNDDDVAPLINEWRTLLLEDQHNALELLSRVVAWMRQVPCPAEVVESTARYSLHGNSLMRENETISRNFVAMRLLPTFDDSTAKFHAYFLGTFYNVDGKAARDKLIDRLLLVFPNIGNIGASMLANALEAHTLDQWALILAHGYRNSIASILSGISHFRNNVDTLYEEMPALRECEVWTDRLEPQMDRLYTISSQAKDDINHLLRHLKDDITPEKLGEEKKTNSIFDIFASQIHARLTETISDCGQVKYWLGEKIGIDSTASPKVIREQEHDMVSCINKETGHWEGSFSARDKQVVLLRAIAVEFRGENLLVGESLEKFLNHMFTELTRNSVAQGFESACKHDLGYGMLLDKLLISLEVSCDEYEAGGRVVVKWSNTSSCFPEDKILIRSLYQYHSNKTKKSSDEPSSSGGTKSLEFLLRRLGGKLFNYTRGNLYITEIHLPKNFFGVVETV